MTRIVVASLIVLLLSFPASAKQAQDFSQPFKLERVIDGDTIVASGRKIRLWGIDAPEKGDPLFRVATMFLESILAEGGLACKFIEQDRYQRDVMYCAVNGTDIGSMMVQMGMARDYRRQNVLSGCLRSALGCKFILLERPRLPPSPILIQIIGT